MSRTERNRKARRSAADFVTAAQAGAELGISPRSVARHAKAGLFPGAILAVGWLIPRKSLKAFKAPERGRPKK